MLIFMFTLTERHLVHSFTSEPRNYTSLCLQTFATDLDAMTCLISKQCHDMIDFKTKQCHDMIDFNRTILCHWATLVQTTASLCGLNLGVARTIESSCIAVLITLIATKRTELHTSSHGCTSKHFHRQSLPVPCRAVKLHTKVFTHTRFYTWCFYTYTLWHADALTHKNLYTQTLLHRDAFTHRRFYTQKLLHTDGFTHRRFYTQTLLHADVFYTRIHAFTHKHFYTQTLLHTDAFTHRHFYTQTLIHIEAFTHRHF